MLKVMMILTPLVGSDYYRPAVKAVSQIHEDQGEPAALRKAQEIVELYEDYVLDRISKGITLV